MYAHGYNGDKPNQLIIHSTLAQDSQPRSWPRPRSGCPRVRAARRQRHVPDDRPLPGTGSHDRRGQTDADAVAQVVFIPKSENQGEW